MKLRNKKTGEIGKLHCDMNVTPAKYGVFEDTDIRGHYWEYNSLAELNSEWEDYEEPKDHWNINSLGEVEKLNIDEKFTNAEQSFILDNHLEIGNYFGTREEAEKAVDKLKAWKRLKDKGFRFIGKTYETDKRFGSIFYKVDDDTYSEDIIEDIDLLFGGEE